MLVEVGSTPVGEMRATTVATAAVRGLEDFVRVAEGLQVDLLLVEGQTGSNITDTCSIGAALTAVKIRRQDSLGRQVE